MIMYHPFQQVNVFSEKPFYGNPLAVIFDADTLSDTQMQQIACWNNLSETAFVLTPTHAQADYRLRLFTAKGMELPFAGHPTLGACHAWLQQGGVPRKKGEVTQECGVGLVELKQVNNAHWCFAAPPMQHQDLTTQQIQALCTMLHIVPSQVTAAQLLDNGRQYTVLLLDHAQTVLEILPDLSAIEKARLNLGVIAPYMPDTAKKADFEVRYFTPASGVPEDPITGNLNAMLAQWLIGTGRAPAQYTAAQGTVLGRQGRVYIKQDASTQQIWVGGDTQTCVQGMLSI